MEKRFYWGVVLLAGLLVGGLLVSRQTERICAPVSRQLNQAAQACLSGVPEQAEALATQAEGLWNNAWKTVASLADHAHLDEIDSLLERMNYHRLAGQTQLFGACCRQLAEMVDAVADAHRLNWWNFL